MENTNSMSEILMAIKVNARLQELIEKLEKRLDETINAGENTTKKYMASKMMDFKASVDLYNLLNILKSFDPRYTNNSLDTDVEGHLSVLAQITKK